MVVETAASKKYLTIEKQRFQKDFHILLKRFLTTLTKYLNTKRRILRVLYSE